MSDIFISYSSLDRDHAEQLTELLASAGLSVWIDQSGIEAAESWSESIVDAIDSCKAFIVMLSPASILSPNVVKEVSLASEKRKKILPLDLEPVELPKNMQYALAGIQRAPMTNIDAIIRALGKLGLQATSAPSYQIVKPLGVGRNDISPTKGDLPNRPTQQEVVDSRKTLMILPFEDLSPTGDNQWFADGIASELISALSNVKALRIADNQATKEFRQYHGQLTTYAHEMQIRYFVQGDVRKFGDQIKISSRLLDIETGDHLWQDSMKGTMNDIFEIQEAVAMKVVEGLKVHLAEGEKKKLAERGTDNPEAYELQLKAGEYYARQTKEGFQLAIQLSTEAINLDPEYSKAFYSKALALTGLFRSYDRDPALLNNAEALCKEALRLKPDLFAAYGPLSMIYMHRDQFDKAEEAAEEFIRKDPQDWYSHFALGFIYGGTARPAKAIAHFEEAVSLKPDSLISLWNLVVNCDGADERKKCAHWAFVALPYFERHLKLHPDDESKFVWHAVLLMFSGNTEAAHGAAMMLTKLKDGSSLYNAAYLFGKLGDYSEGLRTFRKAIEAGFKNIRHLKAFLTDGKEGIAGLAGTPEYEEVRDLVEKIEAEQG